MISYVPIRVDNLELVKDEIYEFSKTKFDVNKVIFKKIEISDMLALPNVRATLEKFNMVDHIEKIFINIIVNYKTHIHIDVDGDNSLQYNLLIPIKHYKNTYRSYYSLKEGAISIPTTNVIHGDGTPINVTRYNSEDVILDYKLRTEYPTIHNTKYPHNFESMTGLPRMMCVFFLRTTWELKPEYHDITISP